MDFTITNKDWFARADGGFTAHSGYINDHHCQKRNEVPHWELRVKIMVNKKAIINWCINWPVKMVSVLNISTSVLLGLKQCTLLNSLALNIGNELYSYSIESSNMQTIPWKLRPSFFSHCVYITLGWSDVELAVCYNN